MEEEGRARFLAVVEEIKQMVAIIGTGLCIPLFNLPLHHSRGGVIFCPYELVCGIAVTQYHWW